ncbi:conserved hypothetical protein [Vibrio chagasii]|nr:conserved hypothetical protein [Vibrio chagasii]CAH6937340.1 conserved hypothetical protein [Vibrio chagasii]CAH6995166.1 conserved hypothetical protein [Vibrio chagasii]CAH7016999.1 conserved hypothetical protein [Vibrio chagasii]CAH7109782.1 conserved hypothetical protein [Vibrio chagasii]
MSFWGKVLIISVSVSTNTVFASGCNSEDWQTLLARQFAFETRYNQYTKEFNQVLSSYESQTLLSKHFTGEQVVELWAKYEQRFDTQLNSHMNTAYDISEVLLKQSYVVSTELEGARSLAQLWEAMAQDCEKAKLMRQSESALSHVKSSQSLSQDLNVLSEKFRQLSFRYRQEATMIDAARQSNEQESVQSNEPLR